MMIKNIKLEQTMKRRQYSKPETKALIMEDLMEEEGDPSFGVNISRPKNYDAHSKENPWGDDEETGGADSTSGIWDY